MLFLKKLFSKDGSRKKLTFTLAQILRRTKFVKLFEFEMLKYGYKNYSKTFDFENTLDLLFGSPSNVGQ